VEEDRRRSADVPAARLFFVFGRAYRAALAYVEAGITTSGIYIGDFAVLEALLHKGPLSMTAIAQKTGLTEGVSIAPAVDRLETFKYIRRTRAGNGDRSPWMVELTQAGRKRINDVYALHAEATEHVLQPLSASERLEFYKALKKIGLNGDALQLANRRVSPRAKSRGSHQP
jgi:MarR family 2-MHQ and catechol resistance regulon transcriptional repressor